jgi:hypothetical protein
VRVRAREPRARRVCVLASPERRLSRPRLVLRVQVILADRVSLERRFLLGPAEARALLLLLQFYANVYGIRIHTVV